MENTIQNLSPSSVAILVSYNGLIVPIHSHVYILSLFKKRRHGRRSRIRVVIVYGKVSSKAKDEINHLHFYALIKHPGKSVNS